MEWKDVGDWLKNNAGTGAALVGSLLVGNIPGAVAAGVSLVTSATGQATPDAALAQLQNHPESVLKLRELANQNEASIREHIRAMTELELKDKAAEHHETQETIRAGDRAEDRFVRWTRPGQSWACLGAAFAYVAAKPSPSIEILLALLALPWAYAGLRQVGHWAENVSARKAAK
jgi:hypothetical protein